MDRAHLNEFQLADGTRIGLRDGKAGPIGTLVIRATYSKPHVWARTLLDPVGGALAESYKVEEATVAVQAVSVGRLPKAFATPAVAAHRVRGLCPAARPVLTFCSAIFRGPIGAVEPFAREAPSRGRHIERTGDHLCAARIRAASEGFPRDGIFAATGS